MLYYGKTRFISKEKLLWKPMPLKESVLTVTGGIPQNVQLPGKPRAMLTTQNRPLSAHHTDPESQ